MAKDDPKATLVWGEGPKEMWSFGETLDIPDDYEFLPAGDAAKTRFVKANAEKYYVHMQRVKQGNRTIGVWAPKAIVEQAQGVTLKTTEEERAAKRQKKQEKDYESARAEIRRQYPRIPDEDLEAVVERAFTVGYGTVGRTGQLSLEKMPTRRSRPRPPQPHRLRHHPNYLQGPRWCPRPGQKENRPHPGFVARAMTSLAGRPSYTPPTRPAHRDQLD